MTHLTTLAGLGLACWLLGATATVATGFLEMRNGYFFDTGTGRAFVPRGIAYQSWNPPVGSDQSLEQIEYDLTEIKRIHANSVRCEMVWSVVQPRPGPDGYDWEKPDFLVQTAEALGLKLFVLVGFQYPPLAWAPTNWFAVNSLGGPSVVLSYEHPEARLAFSNYVARVTGRYRDSPAIGAWILGNEYAYFDLWEEKRRYLGYDEHSVDSFHRYLRTRYGGDIGALNAAWKSSHAGFELIPMPRNYPADRHDPGFHDLIQWRKQSIGDFVALGSRAAGSHDPNHLRTYSMIGGLFGEADVHYTCEDARTIVRACEAASAPLHFWSINNYTSASLDTELRSGDFGISRHRIASGLPVMVSETGHTSTETIWQGAAERQAAAVPGQMWEALMSGAIGTHIFTWNDRTFFSEAYFPRERGFGIVNENRLPKEPVFSNCVELFRRMQQLRLEDVLPGSADPPADVLFFWSDSTDMGWSRANHENIRLWSTLKRLGYEPGILFDDEFEAGEWRQAKALLLSRCYQLEPRHLDLIAGAVVSSGIAVHANADLPGQYDAYHQPHPDWPGRMRSLFGLNVAGAHPGWDGGSDTPEDMQRIVHFHGVRDLGPLRSTYRDQVGTWKVWHGLAAEQGTTYVNHTGAGDSQPATPALHTATAGTARTVVNTFALGDIYDFDGLTVAHSWVMRYRWLRAIYRDFLELAPRIDLSGPGAEFVFPDSRRLHNGSVLLSLLNGHTETAVVTVTAPSLLAGRTIEDLTAGGVLATDSDGAIDLRLSGDQYVLLYAYGTGNQTDQSLINPSPEKVWFAAAPGTVRPHGAPYEVRVGYDTQGTMADLVVLLERQYPSSRTFGRSEPVRVAGKGEVSVAVPVPDADLDDPGYISSIEGGEYEWRAVLEVDGTPRSTVALPVRLVWAVKPVGPLPVEVIPGSDYAVRLKWEELPAHSEPGLTLDRANQWDSLKAGADRFVLVLELRDAANLVVGSDQILVAEVRGSHEFTVHAPADAQGPFRWRAYAHAVSGLDSPDVLDSFEGRLRGARWPDHMERNFLAPWITHTYGGTETFPLWQNEGIQLEGSHGSQSAFLVMASPDPAGGAGFGITRLFPQGEWALPEDPADWALYSFACDFKERHGHECVVQLQIKNDDPSGSGRWLQFSKTYRPGSHGWDTVRATLAEFVPPEGQTGEFDPGAVQELAINVVMITPGVQYVAAIDNIRFEGPDQVLALGDVYGLYDSWNDSFGIDRIELDRQTGTLSLRWSGAGRLQKTETLDGPWQDIVGAPNPYTAPASGAQAFYRLARMR
jgi:hypothetical protein